MSEEVEGMEADAARAADEYESKGGCPKCFELAEPVRVFGGGRLLREPPGEESYEVAE